MITEQDWQVTILQVKYIRLQLKFLYQLGSRAEGGGRHHQKRAQHPWFAPAESRMCWSKWNLRTSCLVNPWILLVQEPWEFLSRGWGAPLLSFSLFLKTSILGDCQALEHLVAIHPRIESVPPGSKWACSWTKESLNLEIWQNDPNAQAFGTSIDQRDNYKLASWGIYWVKSIDHNLVWCQLCRTPSDQGLWGLTTAE